MSFQTTDIVVLLVTVLTKTSVYILWFKRHPVGKMHVYIHLAGIILPLHAHTSQKIDYNLE